MFANDSDTAWSTLPVSGGPGASSFLDLSDAPVSYAAQALKAVRVNAAENALEFFTITAYTDEEARDAIAAFVQNGTGISWSHDDVGNTLTPTVNLAAFSTSNLSEGSNLYWTQARFNAAFSAKTTSDLGEGSNLYYTDVRADVRISAQKGAANGLATLGADSKIPTSQLPAIALTDVFVVASEAAQLALTVEEGDVVIRTDLNKSFIHNGGISGTMDDWSELLSPIDSVLSVNGLTGAVTLTTSNISENTNLYFTTTRAVDAIKADADWNATDWDTAFGWGNHASAGYLTSESDPVFTASQAFNIDATDITNLGNLSGTNTGDQDLSGYALLAGRSGGQTLIGGTGASEALTLQSTSHATKGKILFGTSAYDEVNNRLGIGTASPVVQGHFNVSSNTPVSNPFFPGGVAALFSNDGTNSAIAIGQASDTAAQTALIYFVSSGGTLDTPTAKPALGRIGQFVARGYDGTSGQNAASFYFQVDDTISSGNVPTGITFETGANAGGRLERFRLKSSGEAVFNDVGADYDFRVEGDTNANLLFVDASTDRVGIGTATPGATLDVNGSALFNAGGADADFRIASVGIGNVFGIDASANAIVSGNNDSFPQANPNSAGTGNINHRLQLLATGAIGIAIGRWANNTGATGGIVLTKSRGAAVGTSAAVINGDRIGGLTAAADDGTDLYTLAAQIEMVVDGTVATNRVPGAILFKTQTTGADDDISEKARISANGNLLLGGTSQGASAKAALHLFNGTAPTGSVTNGVILYAEDVAASSELKVRDEAGNITPLSPHHFELTERSEEMAWSYHSERNGKKIEVDMLKLARVLERISGEKLVFIK